MQEVLTLQGGVNGGAFSVYFYENDCFDVHIFDEFNFEKAIPRGLSSQRLRQQLDYIQLGQDDDIIELGVFEKQKPLGTKMHENGTWAHPNVQNDPSTSL